ncbi:CRISPR-associated endonuclease Cas9 [Pontiella desulfatans]|uniref:CRISPR-associated endonuclease Cas9 n=1 Tax=Pontiella desulfatans TaxID=2750659 RepID=A0A6C2U365_PONDE|nr:type II CRISPR RNA-guided endonuclease Cas9 [Pontiella desulfatans]VGO14239.1 CRISPR-associated endonuclease Cas9 [Pontiella desulfatans]
MGKRILGLDLGTNSIGWAVVDEVDGGFEIVKRDDGFEYRGVHIFQEGVKTEKGVESSKASERTGHRAARRIKFRRKLRKIQTLKALSEAGYCPALSIDELKDWQSKKIYPENPAFRAWCKTSEADSKNPYYFRWLAASEVLNLDKEEDRFKIGRVFYHMAQRRGFKSNRLDSTPDEESGVVKTEIAELSKKMGERTLGQYFWEDCYREGKPTRKVHTSRDDHYLAEFEVICEKQSIPADLKEKLLKAIFFQRPLKSQKGSVANCPFEPNKKRCPVSHPLFEEFRMLQVLNNIKIKFSESEEFRVLSEEEFEKAKAKFFRVSKANFDFKDISKELSKGKNKGAIFNYKDYQSLAGCPTISRLKTIFGEDYQSAISERYTGNRENKSAQDILNEVWNVLFSFNDEENVVSWATVNLGLDAEMAKKFAMIQLKQGYASLSLKAISKILPYLEQGLIYSHAVFFANLKKVVGTTIEEDPGLKADIEGLIDTHTQLTRALRSANELLREFKQSPYQFEQKYDLRDRTEFSDSVAAVVQCQINEHNGEFVPVPRLEERVAGYLVDRFGVPEGRTKSLYHPSKEETYKPAKRADDGKLYLESPCISSIKNPVFMRAMHRLKAVVNELLKQGVINDQTIVHVEMAREMNDANKRTALRRWNKKNENKRKGYAEQIEKDLERKAGDDEILKYKLWEEQSHRCIYCGNEISASQMLSAETEIEHTIPRSLCCDNSQENKTITHRECNRKKKNRIPFDCEDYDQILSRVQHWKDEADRLHFQVEKKVGASRAAATKEAKDSAIQARLLLQYERDYLREKYRRFTMEEVKAGFKNSQLVDTRIITKYARLYLNSLFKTVHSVSGKTTDACRKEWGLEEKSRDNHTHHTVDAIVCACLTRNQYDKLAAFYHDYESYEQNDPSVPRKPHLKKPWETFAEDMKVLKNEILVSHYVPNHLLKQTKKLLRKRGKVVTGKNGNPIVMQGKTARGSLHQDTFYGAIKRLDKESGKESTKYVVRKSLADLSESDLKKIVDDRVREIAQAGREKETCIIKAIEKLKKQRATSTEEREAELDAEIAEMESQLNGLYCLPNKNGAPVPIKKVRVYSPLTNPIELKGQRDVSQKKGREHKQKYYVGNDGNHQLAIYEGKNEKGKFGRTYRIANNLMASTGYVFPDKFGEMDLISVVHNGQLVLLFKESKEELICAYPQS